MVAALVLVVVAVWAVALWTDVLWYWQLGYLAVYTTELTTRAGLFVVGGLLMATLRCTTEK